MHYIALQKWACNSTIHDSSSSGPADRGWLLDQDTQTIDLTFKVDTCLQQIGHSLLIMHTILIHFNSLQAVKSSTKKIEKGIKILNGHDEK